MRKRIYRLRVLTGFDHKKAPQGVKGLENIPRFTPLRASQSLATGLYRVTIPPKLKALTEPLRAFK